MSVKILEGDCRDVIKTIADNSIDSVVTDPPYALVSIVKRFGKSGSAAVKVPEGGTGAYARASKGFMGKEWDTGETAFSTEFWAEIFRVLKPGGHVVSFSGTRTYHRMACAIEDAGFEIRDQIGWLYSSGFPKSHDVSKGIDKAAGAVRSEREGVKPGHETTVGRDTVKSLLEGGVLAGKGGFSRPWMHDAEKVAALHYNFAPVTDAAREWQGWATALKPAWEVVALARKPLENEPEWVTVAQSMLGLWRALWSMLPANDAEQFSTLNPDASSAALSASAQWSAERLSNTQADLSEAMGMSQFASALTSSLSTVSSWNATLVAAYRAANTSTIGTESGPTTDLKTLKSSLLRITPESIIRGHKSGQWSSADACIAARHLSAFAAWWNATRELSAVEIATVSDAPDCLDGAAISPSLEPICLARKPLTGLTVAANVLAHGTGAINVDGCRVGTGGGTRSVVGTPTAAIHAYNNGLGVGVGGRVEALDCGRWPANVIHDGSDEVIAAFPDTGASKASDRGLQHRGRSGGLSDIGPNLKEGTDGTRGHDDNGGSAARFFYSAKADKEDRFGSKHPTVKPVDLMQWLVRLVTPKGGTVLDPFAGTGTTGEAAIREGMNCILIEREEEYLKDIRTRLTLAEAGPVARQVGRVKNSGKVQEAGPLFGGAA